MYTNVPGTRGAKIEKYANNKRYSNYSHYEKVFVIPVSKWDRSPSVTVADHETPLKRWLSQWLMAPGTNEQW